VVHTLDAAAFDWGHEGQVLGGRIHYDDLHLRGRALLQLVALYLLG
jgi:hypothetical protein